MPGKSGNCLKETGVFRLNGSFQETGAGMIVDCGMIVVVHCGETTSSPFFWNLPGSWTIEADSEGQYCKEKENDPVFVRIKRL